MLTRLWLLLSLRPIYITAQVANSTDATAAAELPQKPSPDGNCPEDTELNNFCPRCDNSVVKWSDLMGYVATCNVIFSNAAYFLELKHENLAGCIEVCQYVGGCVGSVVSPEGRCLLAVGYTGDSVETVEADGYAILQARYVGLPVQPPSEDLGQGDGTADDTRRLRLDAPSDQKPSRCNATDVSCPTCDQSRVEDALGTTYIVLCDFRVWSDRYYAVQEWLSPAGCLATCDNYTWCDGATSWPEGNCQLARGENAFPVAAPSHTAFLSVDPNFTPTEMPISAFPTGEFTSRTQTAPSPTPTRCDRADAKCPECDGVTIEDSLGEAYRVECNVRPICGNVTRHWDYRSQHACLEHCDADATCLAAIYRNVRCDCCERSLDRLVAFRPQGEYVVFIAETATRETSRTTRRHHLSTSSWGTHSRTTHHPPSATRHATWWSYPSVSITSTFSTTSSAKPVQDINSVSCPSYDNYAVVEPNSERHFGVQCDQGLGAASSRQISVDDFAECAASCTGACGGVQFASSTRCQLFTSISVVSLAAGETVGIHIMYPPSDDGEASTVTVTVTETGSITSSKPEITASFS